MSLNAFPAKTVEPEIWLHTIRMVGTGASAPTLEEGAGVTITRTSAGLYKITWAENPGVFVGLWANIGAATPGDVDGHSVVRDTYDATAYSIEILLSETTPAAHDLAANEYLDVLVAFKQTSV